MKLKQREILFFCFLIYCLIGLVFSYEFGVKHDYHYFQTFWQSAVDGKPFWIMSKSPNAYGPSFSAFIPFYLIHNLLPKLLMTAAYLGVVYLVCFRLMLNFRGIGLCFYLACAYFFREHIMMGHLESVVVFFFLVAILLVKHRPRWAALSFSFSALMKFAPYIALPSLLLRFFSSKRKSLPFVAFSIFHSVIIGACFYWAGKSMLIPLTHARDREPSYFSIFNYFYRQEIFTINEINYLASFIIIISLFVITYLQLKKTIQLTQAIVLTFVCLTLSFKVGHAQFSNFYFLLMPLLIPEEPKEMMKFVLSLLPHWIYLSLLHPSYKFIYEQYGRVEAESLYGYSFIPHIITIGFLIFGVLKCSRKRDLLESYI